MSSDPSVLPARLSANERELAMAAWSRADERRRDFIHVAFDAYADEFAPDQSARKWGNLVLGAYDALESELAQLREIARAAQQLVDDEESGEGGWGPDVTMLYPLVAALSAWRDPDGGGS